MTPKEAFKEIKCQYTHDECKQFPDDDMKIGVRFEEECKVVEQALTELEELKRDVKRFIDLTFSDDINSDDWQEYLALKNKLMKVGKEHV